MIKEITLLTAFATVAFSGAVLASEPSNQGTCTLTLVQHSKRSFKLHGESVSAKVRDALSKECRITVRAATKQDKLAAAKLAYERKVSRISKK